MSAKKTPKELAEEYLEKSKWANEEAGQITWKRRHLAFKAGYEAGQANPTPEAIEKLMPSDEEIGGQLGMHSCSKRNGGFVVACRWLSYELKRRAGGGEL